MAGAPEHQKPALTTDVVLFTFADYELRVLLIERAHPPFEGRWAFPGGFVDYGEPPEVGVLRELQEETGVTNVVVEQVRAFGDPARDPRGHTVSIVFYGFVDAARSAAQGSDDAREARWFSVTQLPELAFDHAKVFAFALDRLRAKFRDGADLLGFLPEQLTVSDLKRIYDTLLKLEEDFRVPERK
jgi:8-oxo-dGTP diphosphatase